ncbi:unnamed protein product [Amoebophrya sp. A25]|nr:unnamed protein product [Amoebophrya sp. A25]|eukprot:GSA25T00002661001.1
MSQWKQRRIASWKTVFCSFERVVGPSSERDLNKWQSNIREDVSTDKILSHAGLALTPDVFESRNVFVKKSEYIARCLARTEMKSAATTTAEEPEEKKAATSTSVDVPSTASTCSTSENANCKRRRIDESTHQPFCSDSSKSAHQDQIQDRDRLKKEEDVPLEDPGEGLFAKRPFAKGELIAFYNGVRMTQAACDAREWHMNANCVTLWKDEKISADKAAEETSRSRTTTTASGFSPKNAGGEDEDRASRSSTATEDEKSEQEGQEGGGVVIDIPSRDARLSAYCGSVGHKANHSRVLVNAAYGPYLAHPRFGDIVCIRALRHIEAGGEVFCDYGYNLDDAGDEASASDVGENNGETFILPNETSSTNSPPLVDPANSNRSDGVPAWFRNDH